MRTRYKVIDDEGYYFVTSSIVEMIPVFTNEKYFQILIDSFKFCQKEKGLKIFFYVLLDNHFHLITSGKEYIKYDVCHEKTYSSRNYSTT